MGSTDPPQYRLIPRTLQRPVLVIVVLGAVAFAALAAGVAGDDSAGRLDDHVDRVVGLYALSHLTTGVAILPGSPAVVVVAAALVAATALLMRRARLVALALLGPGLTGLTTTLLKPAIGRRLDVPVGLWFSFPSGHTAGATSVALVASVAVVGLARRRPALGVLLLMTGPALLGGLVAVGMVAAQAHYPTDTVGGFCIAVVIVLGLALVVDRLGDIALWRGARPVTSGRRTPTQWCPGGRHVADQGRSATTRPADPDTPPRH